MGPLVSKPGLQLHARLAGGPGTGLPRVWSAAGQRSWRPPVDDVAAEVPLEHEAPALDGVEEGLLAGAAVALQPAVEHLGIVALGHLLVQLLVGVDLGGKGRLSAWQPGRPSQPAPLLLRPQLTAPAAPKSIAERGIQAVGKGRRLARPAGLPKEGTTKVPRGARGPGRHGASLTQPALCCCLSSLLSRLAASCPPPPCCGRDCVPHPTPPVAGPPSPSFRKRHEGL